MVTPHLPRKFDANRSSRFLVILLTEKQRKKQRNKETKTNEEIDRKQIPRPPIYRARGNKHQQQIRMAFALHIADCVIVLLEQ